MNHFERTVPVSKLLRMLEHEPNRNARFKVATVYAEPDGRTLEHSFDVPVIIGNEIRGDITRGWDTVLRFPDSDKTFAEYPLGDRKTVWGQNFDTIAHELMGR